jgi:hypothetical protein
MHTFSIEIFFHNKKSFKQIETACLAKLKLSAHLANLRNDLQNSQLAKAKCF